MAEILEDDNGSPAVSERVQSLAKSVYEELEVFVNNYGQESINSLMPLIINILENLDSALSDNQDNLNAVLELNEENQQLVTQYEKEKHQRKEIEEKSLQLETANEEEIAVLKETVSSLKLEVKTCSNKIKNQNEQIEKLDERNEDLKAKNNELHEKNLELIRKQMEAMRDVASSIRAGGARSRDEESSTPTVRAPGFQDFTSSDNTKQKKKRFQPTLPAGIIQSPPVPMEGFIDNEEELTGLTPAAFLTSPVERSNMAELQDEYESEDEYPELNNSNLDDVSVNEQSLFAELDESNALMTFEGLDDIILENKQLHLEKEDRLKELETLNRIVSELKMEKDKLRNQTEEYMSRIEENENEKEKLKKELQASREKAKLMTEAAEKASGMEGLRISRLEIAKVLRERNEWKEKYFSLLEQVRMNDEIYLVKRKDRKSRWLDYFTALFSSSRRRQLEQSLIESSPHRPILTPGTDSSNTTTNEQDHEYHGPAYTGAGYTNTHVIPTLKRVGKKDDEVFMTSLCWILPSLIADMNPMGLPASPTSPMPNINTCRPMSFQEEGAKIFCAASINHASFISDCELATSVSKGGMNNDEKSMSLVWICTGNESLSKVSILDTAAVGEVLETFAVCSSPIICIGAVPSFNDKDPDVLSSLSTKTKKPVQASGMKPSINASSLPTIWMGSDTGVLYVHSAVNEWKRCLHADKLPSSMQAIVYSKGKVFILLQNVSVAVFRRFPDGEWDWDNYEIITIAQKKTLPASTIAAVKYSVWCGVGNGIHVLHTHHLRSEANFIAHASKNAIVSQMLTVGDGVWVAFKKDSVLRLFHATSFAHMQDLDVAPSVHKVIAFGSEKRSNQMPVPVSCITAAQSALWVGTENGLMLNYPFSRPTIAAEETGWEVIKQAEVSGQEIPEPFDVKTEEAFDVSAGLNAKMFDKGFVMEQRKSLTQSFTPFCNIDQVQLSIHAHVNAVTNLLCVPGMIPDESAVYEPFGGIYIAHQGDTVYKPSLFVMSCGEGHLDLRTADKVMQTIHALETGRSTIPAAASIISKKNYIMVWDI